MCVVGADYRSVPEGQQVDATKNVPSQGVSSWSLRVAGRRTGGWGGREQPTVGSSLEAAPRSSHKVRLGLGLEAGQVVWLVGTWEARGASSQPQPEPRAPGPGAVGSAASDLVPDGWGAGWGVLQDATLAHDRPVRRPKP